MITELKQNELLQIINRKTENQPQQVQPPQIQPEKQLTCIQRATNLIDGITDSLYLEIIDGFQLMNKRKRLPALQHQNEDQKKKHKIELLKVDEDEHKKMIRRFMRMNRKLQKNIEKRSIQVVETISKIQEEEQKRKIQERSKTLEARKSQITERLKAKQQMKSQLKILVMQSNQMFKNVAKIKPLYIEKQEKFNKEFVLPKLEEQKKVLQKKKQMMKPIDISAILEHQKLYEQKRTSDRINRSLTSRVLQMQNHYEPPKYVPKSYIIMQAEQDLKKEQQKVKAQELQINEYRKKQFIKMLQQKQKHQSENYNTTLEKNRSKKSISVQEPTIRKERLKQKLTREQTKKKGDDYMKQLIRQNRQRNAKSKAAATENQSQKTISVQDKPKTSQYEFQVVKQQRIQKFHRIRVKKIDEIVNNQFFDKNFKLQRLHHQNEKLNQLVELKKDQLGSVDDGQALSLYFSSIHTKLAILEVASPRKQE